MPRTHIIAFLAGCAAAALAHAGQQTADSRKWDTNSPDHLVTHLVAGVITTIVLPEAKPLVQWGVCQTPGFLRETNFSKSSQHDIVINAIGCAWGVWAGHGYGLKAEGKTILLTYSVAFQ
jgi:hypothetical protein